MKDTNEKVIEHLLKLVEDQQKQITELLRPNLVHSVSDETQLGNELFIDYSYFKDITLDEFNYISTRDGIKRIDIVYRDLYEARDKKLITLSVSRNTHGITIKLPDD